MTHELTLGVSVTASFACVASPQTHYIPRPNGRGIDVE